MDWLNTANGLVTLITGLAGLIGTGIGAFFAIKSLIKNLKDKNLSEIWELIKSIADSAMKEAEKSTLKGADKKEMVMDAVKAGCKSAGVDIDIFIDQLDDYIEQTISFVNEMKKQNKQVKAK